MVKKKTTNKPVKKAQKFGKAEVKEFSKEQEDKYAALLAEPEKLEDNDLREIIRNSKVHYAEANRILEGRKAERKLATNLSA